MLNTALRFLLQFLSQLPLLVILFLIFILLNVLDGHSTWMVLRPDHYHRERNPVARWVFRKLGLPRGIFIFKFVLLLIVGCASAYYAAYDTLTLNIILSVANLVFFFVVRHNYRVFRKMHKRVPHRSPHEEIIP